MISILKRFVIIKIKIIIWKLFFILALSSQGTVIRIYFVYFYKCGMQSFFPMIFHFYPNFLLSWAHLILNVYYKKMTWAVKYLVWYFAMWAVYVYSYNQNQ